MSRRSSTLSGWRHTAKGSAVVAIGVDRRSVGRDNSVRKPLLLPDDRVGQ
jgi:hypothetical protein